MWFPSALLSGLMLFLAAADNPEAARPRPLVTFNVVASDNKGLPVGKLRAADLRIYDDGKLMRADFCRRLETAAGPAAPLGPREYSNRPAGNNSQSTLILLDLLNANIAERGLGWNEIGAALQKHFGEHLYFYLLTKEGTLYPVHALPGDQSRAFEDDTSWIARMPSLLNEAMHAVSRLELWEYRVNVDSRVRKTLDVVRDLASDFAAQPGRKSLVWISHGVPISATANPDDLWRDYTPLVTRLGTDLARSGIAVYAVDQTQRDTMGLGSRDTLQQIASLSGGQWYPTNVVTQAVEQAIGEGPATYQVGYRPPLDEWDNKFHKLRVTTDAKGVRLRAIEGYFGDMREVDPQQRLALAALGMSDAPDIGIRVTATPSERVKGWTHFQIRVDAGDLQLDGGETDAGELRVMLGYYTTGWEVDGSSEVPIPLHFTRAQQDAALRDGVTLALDRPVPTGAHHVRVVVRDTHSGSVGSLTVPVGRSK